MTITLFLLQQKITFTLNKQGVTDIDFDLKTQTVKITTENQILTYSGCPFYITQSL